MTSIMVLMTVGMPLESRRSRVRSRQTATSELGQLHSRGTSRPSNADGTMRMACRIRWAVHADTASLLAMLPVREAIYRRQSATAAQDHDLERPRGKVRARIESRHSRKDSRAEAAPLRREGACQGRARLVQANGDQEAGRKAVTDCAKRDHSSASTSSVPKIGATAPVRSVSSRTPGARPMRIRWRGLRWRRLTGLVPAAKFSSAKSRRAVRYSAARSPPAVNYRSVRSIARQLPHKNGGVYSNEILGHVYIHMVH